MPNALYPPLKPRSFAELLDAVLQIFRLSLLKCLPYATLAIIAGQLWSLYYLSRGRLPVLDANDPIGVAIYGVGTLIFVMLSMTILLRQSTIAAGRPVTGSADLLDTLITGQWTLRSRIGHAGWLPSRRSRSSGGGTPCRPTPTATRPATCW